MHRVLRPNREETTEETGDITISQTEGSAEVVEDAECCLADIDAALEESAECCLAAEAVLVKTWREMTDQELIDEGDPQWDDYYPKYMSGEMTYHAATTEYREHRDRYDQAYESIVGVVNQRDCGCGC